MQTTTVISAQQTRAPVIVNTNNNQMNVSATRGLAITQLVLGALTLILGIVVSATIKHYWVNSSGGAIWGGIWILVTGIIGVVSASQPNNYCLNGWHMAFSIISSVIAFFDGIFFVVAVAYYSNCNFGSYYYYNYNYGYSWRSFSDKYYCDQYSGKGQGLYSTLMVIMIIEFFIAIVAAVFCCKSSNSCCGGPVTTGVIIQQQQQPQMIITSSAGQPMQGQQMYPASTGQPMYQVAPNGQPIYPVSTGMQPMYVSNGQPMYYQQQPGIQGMQQTQTNMAGGVTNVSYSGQVPPPYSEKQ